MQKHLRRAHKHKNSSTLKKGWFSDPAYVTIPLILKKKQTFISSKWFILFRGAFYEIWAIFATWKTAFDLKEATVYKNGC